MMSTSTKPVVMLVVEDNLGDVVLFEEAVKESRTAATTHVVGDGVTALRFLRRLPPFADAPRPDVVVLDLNLPLMTGREVLAEMAADPDLKSIAVAILTTSSSEAHLCERYTPGLCRYFVKTAAFREIQGIVREIAAHAGGESRPGCAPASSA